MYLLPRKHISRNEERLIHAPDSHDIILATGKSRGVMATNRISKHACALLHGYLPTETTLAAKRAAFEGLRAARLLARIA